MVFNLEQQITCFYRGLLASKVNNNTTDLYSSQRAVGLPQFCKDRILGQTLQLASSLQEKTELSVMLKRTT